MSETILLGIEAAIGGGSISLQRGDRQIAEWAGDSKIARAENLLPNIDKLLSRSGLRAGEIDLVAVSAGPGSYTGIRIGIATALGLRRALNVRCVGMSALDALAYGFVRQSTLVALPVGRQFNCVQEFREQRHVSEPELITDEQLVDRLAHTEVQTTVFHHSLHLMIDEAGFPNGLETIDAGVNIARFLCGASASPLATETIEPQFIARGKNA
jgi:tRNA threonylcarbamoyl adenosine modification protein YeaZ